MLRIGIDLGGTKIEGAILDPKEHVLFRERIATEQGKGYEHILTRIRILYDRMLQEINGQTHCLGIGTPGALSHRTGRLKNSNTLCLNDRLTRGDLESLLGHSAAVENDANCFALAEAVCGAGTGHDLVFGVIMGTGCGGGIVSRGNVLRGAQSIGGEWGHMSLDPNGPDCYCGSRGCVETYISGGGLERRFRERYGRELPLTKILEAYRGGNQESAEFMEAFFERFGRAAANLINVLDPDIIVLGGGVSNMDEIYKQGIQAVEKYVFSDSLETPIVRNKLGDSAGVIGAALMGIE